MSMHSITDAQKLRLQRLALQQEKLQKKTQTAEFIYTQEEATEAWNWLDRTAKKNKFVGIGRWAAIMAVDIIKRHDVIRDLMKEIKELRAKLAEKGGPGLVDSSGEKL